MTAFKTIRKWERNSKRSSVRAWCQQVCRNYEVLWWVRSSKIHIDFHWEWNRGSWNSCRVVRRAFGNDENSTGTQIESYEKDLRVEAIRRIKISIYLEIWGCYSRWQLKP